MVKAKRKTSKKVYTIEGSRNLTRVSSPIIQFGSYITKAGAEKGLLRQKQKRKGQKWSYTIIKQGRK
jgi:hypothetical protein